ncbi:hypothetical protein V6N13_127023 [Hibiscus sabdariffa]
MASSSTSSSRGPLSKEYSLTNREYGDGEVLCEQQQDHQPEYYESIEEELEPIEVEPEPEPDQQDHHPEYYEPIEEPEPIPEQEQQDHHPKYYEPVEEPKPIPTQFNISSSATIKKMASSSTSSSRGPLSKEYLSTNREYGDGEVLCEQQQDHQPEYYESIEEELEPIEVEPEPEQQDHHPEYYEPIEEPEPIPAQEQQDHHSKYYEPVEEPEPIPTQFNFSSSATINKLCG